MPGQIVASVRKGEKRVAGQAVALAYTRGVSIERPFVLVFYGVSHRFAHNANDFGNNHFANRISARLGGAQP